MPVAGGCQPCAQEAEGGCPDYVPRGGPHPCPADLRLLLGARGSRRPRPEWSQFHNLVLQGERPHFSEMGWPCMIEGVKTHMGLIHAWTDEARTGGEEGVELMFCFAKGRRGPLIPTAWFWYSVRRRGGWSSDPAGCWIDVQSSRSLRAGKVAASRVLMSLGMEWERFWQGLADFWTC